jgi:hypothetical protein
MPLPSLYIAMSDELSEQSTSQSMLTLKNNHKSLDTSPHYWRCRYASLSDDCWSYGTGPCTALPWIKGLDTLDQVWGSGGAHSRTINITPYYTYNATRHARFAVSPQCGPFSLRRSLVIHLFPVGFVNPCLFDDALLIEWVVSCKVT